MALKPRTTQQITVYLDPELYAQARAISQVRGETMREIIETGLRMRISECLDLDGNLRPVVEKMIEYRQRRDGK